MKKLTVSTALVLFLSLITVAAQRPSTAPPTAPAGKAPDTVLLEELTWAETRDLIKAGTTSVIIGTAGTEQKGPHMVDGERQDAGRARHHLCAGRQLGADGRPHG
jgi:hypothetical protein